MFWLPAFLPGDPATPLVLIGLAVLAYAGQSAAVGGLIGRGHALSASSIVGVEALGRILAFLLVAAGGGTVIGFGIATVVPMTLWMGVLLLFGTWGEVWSMRVAEPTPRFVRNCLFAVGGGACTSLLVNGYPAFLGATSASSARGELAPTMNAIVLTRAPLLLPLLAFQGLIVAFLVRNATRLRATLG